MTNPLRNLITELIFKTGSCVVRVERRNATTGETNLVDYLLTLQEYGGPVGWHARPGGLIRQELAGSPEEPLFLPYHRIRNVHKGEVVYWSSDDPKKVPTNIPSTLEPWASE